MEQSSSSGALAPLTLQRLLDTRQATAVVPGVLYFATTGEWFTAADTTTAGPSTGPRGSAGAAAMADVWGQYALPQPTTTTSSSPPLPMSALATALRDFFVKENPAAETSGGGATFYDTAMPPTCGAVGTDAVFVCPCGTPPYIYRPFFADFGPLDVGCCVLFARRLRELLGAVDRCGTSAGASADSRCSTARQCTASSRLATSDTPVTGGTSGGRGEGAAAAAAPCAFPTSSAAANAAAARPLPVVICASLNAQERVNTACLVGAFCVLALGWSTAATWSRVFANCYPSFLSYRDASTGVSNYPLTLQDVWSGLEQASALGWVGVDSYDLPAYWEGKEQDYSWIVPRRFVAMSSPRDVDPRRTAEVLAQRLRALHVRLVVRLNDSLYNPAPLLRLGIRHVDLPYADGSTPNDATLLQFLQAVEDHFGERVPPSTLRQWWSVPTGGNGGSTARAAISSSGNRGASAKPEPLYVSCSLLHSGTLRGMPETRTAVPPHAMNTPALPAGELGAVAVHCLAGLGRTGTMIAVYMMRHYGFTSRGVIGWMRLCRPGSITGVQQQYLDTIERRLRPSPYVFAAQHLKDYVEALRSTANATATIACATSPSGSFSSFSAASAAHEPADTPRSFDMSSSPAGMARRRDNESSAQSLGGGVGADTVMPVETPWPTPAAVAIAAFQTHGNVVGDARPLTGMTGALASAHPCRPTTASRCASVVSLMASAGGGGDGGGGVPVASSNSGSVSTGGMHAVSRESGQLVNGTAGLWEGGPQGLLLRRTPPPQRPLQQAPRRRSSTSNLSFTADHPEAAALDDVSSMPVLGGVSSADRLSGGRSYTPSFSTAAAAAYSGRRFSDVNSGVGGVCAPAGHTVRALPRVGDYKYASTYFVALERANRRSSPRNTAGANSTSIPTTTTTSGGGMATSGAAAARSSSSGRCRGVNGAGSGAITNNTSIDSTRAPTADTNFPQRVSTCSSAGLDGLSRGASFGRKLSFSSQRRVSLMSMLSNTGASTAVAAAVRDDSSSTGNVINSAAAATAIAAAGSTHSAGWGVDTLLEARPNTATTSTSGLSCTAPSVIERHRAERRRPRRTPQMPESDTPEVQRVMSLQGAMTPSDFPTGEAKVLAVMSPTHAKILLPELPATTMHTESRGKQRPKTLANAAVAAGRGMSTSLLERQLRSERIPVALLPLWGRPVGQA